MVKRESVIFIVILAIFLAFITGCSGNGAGERDFIEEDFQIGTKGIEMNFMKNAPPRRIYEGNELEINIELWNRGAYPDADILDGKLFMSGFDSAAIDGSWDGGNDMPSDLIGKSQFNPMGGYDSMSYRDTDGVHVPFEADKYEPRIMVTACYRYKTLATPLVCVDPSPFDVIEEDKVCYIDDTGEVYTDGRGQGGPVDVYKVIEEVGSDRLYFRIFIKNSGDGGVIHPSAYDSCPYDLASDELNRVVVDVEMSHDSSPNCHPEGTASDPVWLDPDTGRGYIFCDFSLPGSQSTYESPIKVEIDYVYTSSIYKDIEILKLS